MKNRMRKQAITASVGSLLIGSVAGTSSADADNPFSMSSIKSGYMQVAFGKCGSPDDDRELPKKEEKKKEGKCGEGTCGKKEGKKEGKSSAGVKAPSTQPSGGITR